jgi:hypothetical protein
MKTHRVKLELSEVELNVLETIRNIGIKSAFQMADNLSKQYDVLTVIRSLHTLLKKDLVERFSLQGERYYKLNERNLIKIQMLLNQTKVLS